MRDYGKVYSSFWTSKTTQGLSDDGRILALYLLTCEHSTIGGVCRLPDGYVCEDLKWGSERVSEGFRNLWANGFATRCEATKWVFIHRYLDWNPPENPNQRKALEKVAEQIPEECIWLKAFLAVMRGEEPEPFGNPFETVSKPVTVVVAVTEAVTVTGTVAVGSAKSSVPAKAETAPDKALNVETWNAYAEAYEQRYRAPPVRNAKVNGQIAQLGKRIGSDAPQVAAWFIRNQNAYYLQRGHSVDCLLADCEKLRTEWATGRTVTATQARVADKSASNPFMKLLMEKPNDQAA